MLWGGWKGVLNTSVQRVGPLHNLQNNKWQEIHVVGQILHLLTQKVREHKGISASVHDRASWNTNRQPCNESVSAAWELDSEWDTIWFPPEDQKSNSCCQLQLKPPIFKREVIHAIIHASLIYYLWHLDYTRCRAVGNWKVNSFFSVITEAIEVLTTRDKSSTAQVVATWDS